MIISRPFSIPFLSIRSIVTDSRKVSSPTAAASRPAASRAASRAARYPDGGGAISEPILNRNSPSLALYFSAGSAR